ncbi:hypothetical protein ROHU_003225 [Labeo rohita]|uniref:Uncharacterized protein n=1 Tax=Labeo rohita TaxID=84645 RepID=A0A498NVC7_LABRO|nr:hypothetical protein ROHU_026541 [Labeo rohita]RXN36120.1 hypothetical protein ROHU_003225 [Labeo rohita]
MVVVSGGRMGRALVEQSLLRQCGSREDAPAGADTTAAGWKNREGSCGSGHYCGSVEIQRKHVLEWTLLRRGSREEAPSLYFHTAAVVSAPAEELLALPNDMRMPGKLGVSAVEVRLNLGVWEIVWLIEQSGGRDGARGLMAMTGREGVKKDRSEQQLDAEGARDKVRRAKF